MKTEVQGISREGKRFSTEKTKDHLTQDSAGNAGRLLGRRGEEGRVGFQGLSGAHPHQ